MKFEFSITDDNGEYIDGDYVTFAPENIEGAGEMIDLHIGSALRRVRRAHREQMLKAEAV